MELAKLDDTPAHPDFVAVLRDGGLDVQSGGQTAPDFSTDQLDKLRGARPTAQKIDGWILCAAPIGSDQTLVHGYRGLPRGVALSDLIRAVENSATASAADATPRTTDRLRDAAIAVSKLPPKKRLGQVLYAIRDAGFNGIEAMAVLKRGKVKSMHFASKTAVNIRDELRAVIASVGDASDTTDLDLIAGSLGGRSGTLFRPDDPENGLAFFGVDLDQGAQTTFEETHGFFAMLTDAKTSKGRGGRVLWGAFGLACVVAAGLYLAAPAPVYVSNFAQARASQSMTVALPFGAFLEDALVRPGQMLAAGEVAAVLRSPEIENGIAEQKVSHSLELINAQDALNAGNYGEFQLAEKRAEIALLRQEQLEDRLAQLTVTAPVDSRVVTALPDGDRGDFLPTGTPVVTLQPTNTFDLIIDVAPQDSALVQAGQQGHVFFRGLSDETFEFEILSTVTQSTDQAEPRTQVRARVLDADQADLLVGLSGFARIETRTAPRIVGLTRPIVDYVRLLLWKTLGFTF